jgi:hypothetical protein
MIRGQDRNVPDLFFCRKKGFTAESAENTEIFFGHKKAQKDAKVF